MMQVLNGFVKIHRKLIQWGWYKDNVVKGVFLHLILTASFKETCWMDTIIHKGELVTTNKRLADDLGLSVKQVRTALKKLERTGELAIKATNKYSLITVVNWEDYQCYEEENGKQKGNQKANEGQHLKNNKNIKECKENKAPISPSLERELTTAGITYEEYERI